MLVAYTRIVIVSGRAIQTWLIAFVSGWTGLYLNDELNVARAL